MRFQPLTNSSNNTGIIRFGGMEQITDQVNALLVFVAGFNDSIKSQTVLRRDNGISHVINEQREAKNGSAQCLSGVNSRSHPGGMVRA